MPIPSLRSIWGAACCPDGDQATLIGWDILCADLAEIAALVSVILVSPRKICGDNEREEALAVTSRESEHQARFLVFFDEWFDDRVGLAQKILNFPS